MLNQSSRLTGEQVIISAPPVPKLKAIAKRGMDIVGASAMLVFFAPLMLMLAGLVRYHDGRGVIYSHVRVGRGGQPFRCLKFRTMVRDADEKLAELLRNDPAARHEWSRYRKLRDDPRILPGIGTLMRRASLDELPQIINVLRGDMSLVGPRPVVEDELAHYGPAAALYIGVRPGLTGPWQIGARSEAEYGLRVSQDIDYVRNWTIATDLHILLRTALIFLRGRSPGAF